MVYIDCGPKIQYSKPRPQSVSVASATQSYSTAFNIKSRTKYACMHDSICIKPRRSVLPDLCNDAQVPCQLALQKTPEWPIVNLHVLWESFGQNGIARAVVDAILHWKHITGWWFGTFFIFPYIGNNHPNWLIFFRGVQTTNQIGTMNHSHRSDVHRLRCRLGASDCRDMALRA